ncbi:MAG: SMC-Scp complex subunit ScpB [Wenzhouxiangellaceae bacterium]|nr:SMC-Scp complex subunit ScpB [Wenzhouxiangellaceae bacterium]
MDPEKLKILLEGALLAASQPLSLNQLNGLFPEDEQPGHGSIREALSALDAELASRAVELVEVASGYRLQIRQDLMPVISRLWEEKPPRYSRALLETLAIIAYRQPITRGEIEQIRGVSLSANILKTLQEREWIKVLGHRDIPGRPELLGSTREFLDYFNLKGLDDLPTLAEIRDLESFDPELALNDPNQPHSDNANDPAQTQQDQQQDDDAENARHDDGQHVAGQPGSQRPAGTRQSERHSGSVGHNDRRVAPEPHPPAEQEEPTEQQAGDDAQPGRARDTGGSTDETESESDQSTSRQTDGYPD